MGNREFIRHPSAIKIDYQIEDIVHKDGEHLNDISYGGLSFYSYLKVEIGKIIRVSIPVTKPEFSFDAEVVRCVKSGDNRYLVGVKFLNYDEAFKTRMIEQICYIEEYKEKIFKEEGRQISSEEAAVEWIKKYADKFPQI